MTFTMDIYNLLIRYTKDSEGLEVTLQDLYKLPWWKCVWQSWEAEAYYKTNGYYQRIEDVPEGLESYHIIADDVNTHYFIGVGGFPVVQVMTTETCKSIYGS